MNKYGCFYSYTEQVKFTLRYTKINPPVFLVCAIFVSHVCMPKGGRQSPCGAAPVCRLVKERNYVAAAAHLHEKAFKLAGSCAASSGVYTTTNAITYTGCSCLLLNHFPSHRHAFPNWGRRENSCNNVQLEVFEINLNFCQPAFCLWSNLSFVRLLALPYRPIAFSSHCNWPL